MSATSFERHLEATSLLLENGADPNSQPLGEGTALYGITGRRVRCGTVIN